MRPAGPERGPLLRAGRAWAWLIVAGAALLVGAGAGLGAGWLLLTGYWAGPATAGPAPTSGPGASAQGAAKQLYTCGMHPTVIQEGPGECPICHMKLTPLRQEAGAGGSAPGPQERKVLYWRAPMDPNYISDSPGKSPMGMDLVPVYAEQGASAVGPKVTIDPVTIQNMGIRTTVVRRGPLVKTIRTLGRVDYDEQTVAFINTKFDGWIEKLYVDETGVQVEKGEPLFEVYSPALYAAQEELLAALRTVERLSASTAETRRQAQRTVEAARVRLRYYDVTPEQIERLERSKQIQKNLTIHSPARGIVTEKMALEGMYVRPGMRLYTIADLSRVWVYVDIYEYQLPWVWVGQEARMELAYVPEHQFLGQVVYVYPYLQQQTRVIKVRLEFENPRLELKPEMYANVTLYADLGREALLIPRDAYIDSGLRKVAFVDLGNGQFQPRDIQVGVQAENGMVEVRYGLDAGERIVTSGQFLIDSESKLREAITKMMAARAGRQPKPPAPKRPATTAPAASRPEAAADGGLPPDARYACPMEQHPDQSDPAQRGPYFAAQPGRCPRCGMKLKPLDELDWVQTRRAAGQAEVAYTCPDHPHVFSPAAGTCPRCGRELEPFKVMYTCPDPEHGDVISERPGTCPRDRRELAPYRGIWLSPEMAEENVPPNPEAAAAAAYRCPLHPLVHSDRPGRCLVCARQLEPVEGLAAATQPGAASLPAAARYVCPMHPAQVSSARQGSCPICGMTLVDSAALPHPRSAPAAIAVQVNYLMEHYLELQRRLASDRTAELAMHARGLAAAAETIGAQLAEPGVELPPEFARAVKKLNAAALKLDGANLAQDRVAFVELSAAMRAVVRHVRPDKRRYPKIYVFHCPMSKGDWLQASAEMANPYYGFRMLKCGELRETR